MSEVKNLTVNLFLSVLFISLCMVIFTRTVREVEENLFNREVPDEQRVQPAEEDNHDHLNQDSIKVSRKRASTPVTSPPPPPPLPSMGLPSRTRSIKPLNFMKYHPHSFGSEGCRDGEDCRGPKRLATLLVAQLSPDRDRSSVLYKKTSNSDHDTWKFLETIALIFITCQVIRLILQIVFRILSVIYSYVSAPFKFLKTAVGRSMYYLGVLLTLAGVIHFVIRSQSEGEGSP